MSKHLQCHSRKSSYDITSSTESGQSVGSRSCVADEDSGDGERLVFFDVECENQGILRDADLKQRAITQWPEAEFLLVTSQLGRLFCVFVAPEG